MNSPKGNEQWQACDQEFIDWNSIATSDSFDIQYSIDNGVSWINIATNFFSMNGELAWTLPKVTSTNFLVRATDHNSPISTDENNSSLSIIGPAANAEMDVTPCNGESNLLQGTGEIVYNWSPTLGLTDPAASNTIASPTITPISTLTSTDSFGCTAAAVATITIDNGLPDIEGGADNTAYNFNPSAKIDNRFCLHTSGGNGSCPTDIDGDGIVSTSDLLLILGAFRSTCQ
ncbi:MAG: hypothetical protein ACI898_000847 [Flavobacteriales bacterium]|jgi:hypothetical protein